MLCIIAFCEYNNQFWLLICSHTFTFITKSKTYLHIIYTVNEISYVNTSKHIQNYSKQYTNVYNMTNTNKQMSFSTYMLYWYYKQ